jgi:hypothetical protein
MNFKTDWKFLTGYVLASITFIVGLFVLQPSNEKDSVRLGCQALLIEAEKIRFCVADRANCQFNHSDFQSAVWAAARMGVDVSEIKSRIDDKPMGYQYNEGQMIWLADMCESIAKNPKVRTK